MIHVKPCTKRRLPTAAGRGYCNRNAALQNVSLVPDKQANRSWHHNNLRRMRRERAKRAHRARSYGSTWGHTVSPQLEDSGGRLPEAPEQQRKRETRYASVRPKTDKPRPHTKTPRHRATNHVPPASLQTHGQSPTGIAVNRT